MVGEGDSSAAALRSVEEWSARIHRGLRSGSRVDAEAVRLACLLLDWGHDAEVVRDLVTRDPAQVPAPEMARLAAELLRVCGFDPGFALAPERLPVLERAVEKVAADFAGCTVVDGLHLVQADEAGPRALLALGDGTLLSTGNGLAPSAGDDPVHALVEVAAEVQDEVAARFRLVWPVCRDHGLGVRPAAADGSARWRCAGGPPGHFVGEVGALTTPGTPGTPSTPSTPVTPVTPRRVVPLSPSPTRPSSSGR
ncbi:hypothetical protein OG896_37520 [Streptomyces sp. NBC_00669]|uniref:hypothetical protein n=1 Tax=Streptomyces sp. NBC_00669 TaxID=2976011 RepID=UPI002E2FD7BE|nr:hypothetical protein [Streptomyces sp. NBC_00669]